MEKEGKTIVCPYCEEKIKYLCTVVTDTKQTFYSTIDGNIIQKDYTPPDSPLIDPEDVYCPYCYVYLGFSLEDIPEGFLDKMLKDELTQDEFNKVIR